MFFELLGGFVCLGTEEGEGVFFGAGWGRGGRGDGVVGIGDVERFFAVAAAARSFCVCRNGSRGGHDVYLVLRVLRLT